MDGARCWVAAPPALPGTGAASGRTDAPVWRPAGPAHRGQYWFATDEPAREHSSGIRAPAAPRLPVVLKGGGTAASQISRLLQRSPADTCFDTTPTQKHTACTAPAQPARRLQTHPSRSHPSTKCGTGLPSPCCWRRPGRAPPAPGTTIGPQGPRAPRYRGGFMPRCVPGATSALHSSLRAPRRARRGRAGRL